MDTFTGNISAIQMDIASMRQDFENIKVNNSTLQSVPHGIKQEAASLEIETKKMKDAANGLSRDIRTLKEKSSIMVAFHARLHEKTYIACSPNTTALKFGDVTCNLGEAYDHLTGVFVAPVTGIYFFVVKAVSSKGTAEFCLRVLVNNSEVSRSLSTESKVESEMSCTLYIAQRVTQGQLVSVSSGVNKSLKVWTPPLTFYYLD